MNKRKNVVFLVIDSLANYNRRNVEGKLMPFLNQLKEKSVYFPNMFSEAPYTEAAVMSMLCGKDTLQDEGYFYRFDKSHNIFDSFLENGYEVFNYVQPHVYPSSILKGNTHTYHNVAYDFNVVWAYRLYLYHNLYKENKLTEKDYQKVITLLDDNLNFWTYFLEMLMKKDDSLSLIQENMDRLYDVAFLQTQYEKVVAQKEKYAQDKKAYVTELLEKGKEHEIFDIKVLDQNIKVSEETKKWLRENYEVTFQRIYSLNKKQNFKLGKINWRGVCQDAAGALKTKNIQKLKHHLGYFRSGILDRDLMERLYESDSFKAAPSLYSHINHFEKALEKWDAKAPFFSCIHVDDIHHPEDFFTYDTDNLELIKEEFEDIKRVMDMYEKGMSGSLSYYLALAYIDKKIKYLFDVLEKKGLLEDTIIVITGDHGFSFDYICNRNSTVNNHYLENYNVPLYIYDAGCDTYVDERICSSKDILPTLLERLELKALDANITGASLWKEKKEYVILQNVMGGCPDMDHRPVTLAILTGEELLVADASLASKFTDVVFKEYYDLKKDPHQKINAIKKQKDLENKKIAKILKEEFHSLYQNVAKNRGYN